MGSDYIDISDRKETHTFFVNDLERSTKLNKPFIAFVDLISRIWIYGQHEVRYYNTEVLRAHKDKPLIILPNHQYMKDIAIEHFVHQKHIGNDRHFVMKASLPRFLKYLGGIGITRGKDLKSDYNGLDRKERLRKKHENAHKAQVENAKVSAMIVYVLSEGRNVFVHSEGTRNKGDNVSMSDPKKNLNNILKLQPVLREYTKGTENYIEQISFLPMDIEYADRGIVNVTIGSVIKVEDDGLDKLVEHWFSEVPHAVITDKN